MGSAATVSVEAKGVSVVEDPETDATIAALRAMRRRLAVAYLAVEQLCRKTACFPPAQRFCSFATDALTGIKDEVSGIETRLMHGEHRTEGILDEVPDHPAGP